MVDGPLRSRRQLPRALGYVKTHRGQYLPPELTAVVGRLRAGPALPGVPARHRLAAATSWYLRLPGPVGSPWAGIVRVECSRRPAPPTEAIALADLSAVTLPRFASTPYKDPRAPQNLTPIAGLERRLRGMLGDARLLHRALTIATRVRPPRGRSARSLIGPPTRGDDRVVEQVDTGQAELVRTRTGRARGRCCSTARRSRTST